MRGGRSLLVLLVLAAGLGAYIYFVESKRDLTDPATRKDKVFSVETGKIEEVQLRSPNGNTTLKKNGTTWQIVAPVTAAADEYTVSSLVYALETLEGARHRVPMAVNPATETLYIVNPFSGKGATALFSTHPPIAERIKRLREYDRAAGVHYG